MFVIVYIRQTGPERQEVAGMWAGPDYQLIVVLIFCFSGVIQKNRLPDVTWLT